jgi:molybdopterin molybdotransferase
MAELPTYEQACARALACVKPLGSERIALENADGRILGENIQADRDLPPFNRAQMDGYAIRAAEVGTRDSWRVAGSVHAGQSPVGVRAAAGECIAISTGAALPDGLDAVIPHEWSDRADPVRFTIGSIAAGHAVHARGDDARQGQVLLHRGSTIRPQHLGIAASVGRANLLVARRPRVHIISSGDEVIPPGSASIEPHQIRNSNAPMLLALLARFGAEPVHHQHISDDADATRDAVARALDRGDAVISIGGISAGDRDHFHGAYDRAGITTVLQGAAIQPGRPIFIGTRHDGRLAIGLPGNPVSVLACACLFVWPIVRAMCGLDTKLPWRDVELAEPARPNAQRWAFRPCRLIDWNRAVVPRWAGSGDLAHTAGTDGLLALPRQAETVNAGEMLRFLPWP